MSIRLLSLITGLTVALALLSGNVARAEDKAAGIDGKWKSEMAGRNNQTRTTIYTFKQDGEKLTGTVKSDREGAQEAQISDGTIKNNEISFKVTRKMQDREFTSLYTGKLEGDKITGKVKMGEGDQARERDWTATRVKE